VTAYLVPEVWCDVCLHRVVAEDTCTTREHRADLRDAGWVRRQPVTEAELDAWDNGNGSRFVDVCPECAEPVQ
jgi:hypothetical protein